MIEMTYHVKHFWVALFDPRTYTQIHTSTVVLEAGAGWMEPLSRDFDMLQYFETILPLEESLWSS